MDIMEGYYYKYYPEIDLLHISNENKFEENPIKASYLEYLYSDNNKDNIDYVKIHGISEKAPRVREILEEILRNNQNTIDKTVIERLKRYLNF